MKSETRRQAALRTQDREHRTSPRRLDSERLRRASRQQSATGTPGDPPAFFDATGQGTVHSVIGTASRALAAGDPLTALNWVALRNEAPALALRGIAMAQLGDLVRGKALLKRASRAFGPKDAL